MQISEEGQYVYFVAKGALTGPHGEALRNASGVEPVAADDNLYLSHEGRAPVFVATLAASDSGDWNAGGEYSGLKAGPEINSAVVSPSGGYLAFASERSLTGYDNEPAQPVDCTDEQGRPLSAGNPSVPCKEVYLYDATTGATSCASCDPTGARPVGPSGLRISSAELAFPPSFGEYRPRNLLEDGTLFFNSSDALVPHASDGRQNVYEYEAGRTYAISNVTGGHESFFLDSAKGPNGEEGGNVFFATADQLLPEDVGNNVVVYDARAGGGFPVHVNPAACTTAEACRAGGVLPSPQQGIYGPPATATFNGPGNLTPPPPLVPSKPKPKSKTVKCKRGFVKKKVKKKELCVKKKSKKTKAKKSAKTNRRTGR